GGRLLQLDGGVRNQWSCPESDAQHAAEGKVKEAQAVPQAEMIAETTNNDGADSATHDSRAQDSRERPVMFGHRIQRQRDQYGPYDRSEKPDARESIESDARWAE